MSTASSNYLRKASKQKPLIVDSVGHLLSDKPKLFGLGVPVRILSDEVLNASKADYIESLMVRIKVNGKKKRANLILSTNESVKNQQDF